MKKSANSKDPLVDSISDILNRETSHADELVEAFEWLINEMEASEIDFILDSELCAHEDEDDDRIFQSEDAAKSQSQLKQKKMQAKKNKKELIKKIGAGEYKKRIKAATKERNKPANKAKAKKAAVKYAKSSAGKKAKRAREMR